MVYGVCGVWCTVDGVYGVRMVCMVFLWCMVYVVYGVRCMVHMVACVTHQAASAAVAAGLYRCVWCGV